MDRPKIFNALARDLILADIDRLGLVPQRTKTQTNERGKEQWDVHRWEHPYIRDLQSCYDRRTTEHMFYSWAYPP